VLLPFGEGNPAVNDWVKAFQDELQRLGWEQGRNIQVEYRLAGTDVNRLRTEAAELIRFNPDVLFTAGTSALAPLARETRSIPIVFVQVSDPVKLGLVASLAQPGGNITGFANFEHPIGGKWLELIKDTAPGRTHVGILFDPDNPSQIAFLQGIEAAAPASGVQLVRAGVRNATDIERSIDALAQSGDLPVQLASKVEFVINLKTAKTLGLDVPLGVTAGADEVIE
jgi:putative tryptophan/tyrosine transport system substrate-binding protein